MDLYFPYYPVECIVVPQRVVCQGCGHVLYQGAELKPPDEVLHQHDWKCPKCGKKLALIPIDVDVKPIR
jgi:rubredoxin